MGIRRESHRNIWTIVKPILVLIGIFTFILLSSPRVSAMVNYRIERIFHYLNSLSRTVTITAIPIFGSMPPQNFRVEEINREIVCSWDNPPTSVVTEIRAKFGSIPLSQTDGYQVYYGPGTTATDTGVMLDENVSEIYYVAYAKNSVDIWSSPVSDIFKGGPMLLIIVVLAFLGLAFWRQTRTLKIVAGLLAIVFGAYWATFVQNNYVYIASGVAYAIAGLYLILTVGSSRA